MPMHHINCPKAVCKHSNHQQTPILKAHRTSVPHRDRDIDHGDFNQGGIWENWQGVPCASPGFTKSLDEFCMQGLAANTNDRRKLRMPESMHHSLSMVNWPITQSIPLSN